MAGIYLHIPFCNKLCYYCDFYHVIAKGDYSEFSGFILKEAALRKEYLGGETITTIYLGGGTPSVLPTEDHERLIHGIKEIFEVDVNCEITIEMNPDDVTMEYLTSLKKLGINRVSLGIQSWRNEDLKFLNRRHDAARAETALGYLFDAGFENVSVDLIYGIPGMSPEDWERNLDRTFRYNIKHLSAYHLTIEPGTVFGTMKKKGKLQEISEEDSNNLFNILTERDEQAGFVHY